jgi:5-(carboxyamino)imidazole ribonucleotide mutase
MENYKVSIIMGSDSDLKIMSPAIDVLKEFGIESEVAILSAHRTPELLDSYVKGLKDRGIMVAITGAGGAAALPGVVASITTIPVIGVPIKSSISIDGWDSILSILQMPSGIPVATMSLNGAKNAGLLAVRIISLSDESVAEKLDEYIIDMKMKVIKSNDAITAMGYNAADLDII